MAGDDQSGGRTREERLLGVIVYLAPLLGGFFILPIVTYLVCRDSSFVRRHSKRALIFQVSFVAAIVIVAFLPPALRGSAVIGLVAILGYAGWIGLVIWNARRAWKEPAPSLP